MRLFMFALFVVIWAAVGLTYYYKHTNKGRKRCAYEALEDAETVSEMADVHIRAAEIAKRASAKISEEAAAELTH